MVDIRMFVLCLALKGTIVADCLSSYSYGGHNKYCCSYNVGVIAGIVIGCLFGLAVMIALVVACCAAVKKSGTSGRVIPSGQSVAMVQTSQQQQAMYPPPQGMQPQYGYPPSGQYPPPGGQYPQGGQNPQGGQYPPPPPSYAAHPPPY
ncbi:rhodopsin-like isoform X1 [Mytilus trossulus]|uniref:rhodopsin-like isoform X1 n=1 Tax=Mytilus trossulus TaxID=6551 RepID=UPI00300612AE